MQNSRYQQKLPRRIQITLELLRELQPQTVPMQERREGAEQMRLSENREYKKTSPEPTDDCRVSRR